MKKLVKNQRDYYPVRSFFDDFFNGYYREIEDQENVKLPAVDLIENEKNYKVNVNLPGFKKDEINISLNDNELLIEAKHQEKKNEKKRFIF